MKQCDTCLSSISYGLVLLLALFSVACGKPPQMEKDAKEDGADLATQVNSNQGTHQWDRLPDNRPGPHIPKVTLPVLQLTEQEAAEYKKKLQEASKEGEK